MLEQQIRPSLQERASASVGGLFGRFPAASSIVGALVAVIATNVLLRPRFETNDDTVMMYIADGTIFGEPSEHLVYTNVVIGKILAGLYSITTGITWYSLYLYAALAASFAVTLYLFATGPRMARREAIVVGSAVFVVTLYSWMNLQFTTTAAILASAGAVLYVFGPPDDVSLKLPLLGGLMAGVATMIRFEGALLPLAVFAPFLVVAAVSRGGRRLAAFVVPVLLIAGGANLYSASVYDDSAWTDFFEWNSHRALLHDTPRLDQPADDIEVLEAVGWSVNDAEIFNRWMVFDDEVFSDDAVRTVGELTSPGFEPLRLAKTVGLSGFLQFGVCLVALLVAIVLFGSTPRRDRLLYAGMIALAGTALTYLLITAKLPGPDHAPFAQPLHRGRWSGDPTSTPATRTDPGRHAPLASGGLACHRHRHGRGRPGCGGIRLGSSIRAQDRGPVRQPRQTRVVRPRWCIRPLGLR